MMLALRAHLHIFIKRFFPDDLPAAFAFKPQPLGADALFRIRCRFHSGFFPRKPSHSKHNPNLTDAAPLFTILPTTSRRRRAELRPGGQLGESFRLDELKPIYISLALLLLILIVYGQVVNFDFVNFDDRETILSNPHIRDGVTMEGLKWAFGSAFAANWFPLTWISHMVDFQLFGLDAGKFHLVNVLIHAVNALLLFALFRRITGRKWESAFVAFVFGLHPLHVESVAWVSERKDVLSAFFWILTMWLYADYVRRPKIVTYLIALAAFALGLMSKQMLVTLPFALLLVDYWPLDRVQKMGPSRLILEKVPFLALSAVASIITYKVQHQTGAILASTVPLTMRGENALIAYVAYLAQFFWPFGLSVFYPYPASFSIGEVVGAAIVLTAISALALRRKYLAMGWLWYLGTLVPVVGLVQVGMQERADRYTYIPMIGISVMLAWGVAEIMERRPKMSTALKTVSIAACVASVVLTFAQVAYWQNSVTLFEHAIASTENNFLAHLYLGTVLAEQGRANEALRHLYASVEEKPDFFDAHDSLGALLGRLGKNDEAAAQFEQAIRLQPTDSEGHCNLGNVRLAQGKLAEAADEFNAAIHAQPSFAAAHFGLGVVLINQSRFDESIAQFQEALRLDPGLTPARDAINKAISLKRGW